MEDLLHQLRERAKELSCLYAIEDALSQTDQPLEEVLRQVVAATAQGMMYPEIAAAQVVLGDLTIQTGPFTPTPWELSTDIHVGEEAIGRLSVYYLEPKPTADSGPFLNEEVRLVKSIAERLSLAVERKRMREANGRHNKSTELSWHTSLELLRRTDKSAYIRIVRKLINHLCSIGDREAQTLLTANQIPDSGTGEANQPGRRRLMDEEMLLSQRPIEIAEQAQSDEELLSLIQRWLYEDKASFFLKVLDRPTSSPHEVGEALRRFHQVQDGGLEVTNNVNNGLRVSLIRRMLTEQLEYIMVAKRFLDTRDFETLFDHLITPADSHGKVGGKSSGLFLAHRIIEQVRGRDPNVASAKVPKTWYLASDGIKAFMRHNDLEEVMEQKYKPIEVVRREYPNIVQLFTNSRFPPEIIQGLSLALDDFGDRPLVVRSSSLLEDRLGTAFSGKYKSLFLANQGDKHQQLAALLDAIAEIYASVFSPDPIEYRQIRRLLDFNEEMGILLQEVVGQKVGDYFLPAFAGVAFTNNEFRWSPRINRRDGLVRLVPGLGTRAVDRIGDDYPVLAVPHQPNLRVNASVDETARYSPQKVDAINLRSNSFETLDIKDLLLQAGSDLPGFFQIFSVLDGDRLKPPNRMLTDPERDTMVVTFDGLLSGSPFLRQIGTYLELLEESMDTPVDIEFAHDGIDFYLLQCRPQSNSDDSQPVPIPKDLPLEDVIFSAKRYVSNGWVPDITHIVYVDPQRYGELGSHSELLDVGRAVGRLNTLLPKRQFILMGPGRWGSRGDIKLGVNVTYSDISNTAMLIEIARTKGNYSPDLSFGTHFFQDLVESRIRYLPLYPDQDDVPFNERFLLSSRNVLVELLPEYAHIADCLRIIDVPRDNESRVLRVLQNADLDEAIAYLTQPNEPTGIGEPPALEEIQEPRTSSNFWAWRFRMAEHIAAELPARRFGVVAFYVFGSTKNATAGPGSDIDVLVHFRGDETQRSTLLAWLDGWSRCLAEINYLRTGYRTDQLLDVHLVTDQDIASRTSFAIKIGAVTDAARLLPIHDPAS